MSDGTGIEAMVWEVSKEPIVQPRRSPDEQAQADWQQVLDVLKMVDDQVHAGARIRISRSPVFPNADHVALMKSHFEHALDRILNDVILIGPEASDYVCTGGHDRCHGGTSRGPECPYCEPVYA